MGEKRGAPVTNPWQLLGRENWGGGEVHFRQDMAEKRAQGAKHGLTQPRVSTARRPVSECQLEMQCDV